MLVHQGADDLSSVLPGPPLRNLHLTVSRQGFESDEQIRRAVAGVLAIFSRRLTRPDRRRLAHLSM
jgi:hypothetical protein